MVNLFMKLASTRIGLIAILLVVFGGIGYAYFTWTQHKIADLKDVNETLQEERDTYESAFIDEQVASNERKKQNDKLFRELRALRASNERAEKYTEQLIDILTRHELEYLAYKKPGLIENRINNATAKVFESIETLTDPSSDSE